MPANSHQCTILLAWIFSLSCIAAAVVDFKRPTLVLHHVRMPHLREIAASLPVKTAISVSQRDSESFSACCGLVREFGQHFLCGASTVSSAEQAHKLIDNGVAFLSSTKFSAPVSSVCRERQVPLLCGVGSVAEAMLAISHGESDGKSAFFKVYPVSAMSENDIEHIVSAIKSTRGEAQLIAAGGVQRMTPTNLLRRGFDGIALGFDMTKCTPQQVVSDFIAYVNEWEAAVARHSKAQ